MKITKIGNLALWRTLCAVFALLLILGVAGDTVTKEWSGYINPMLGVSGTRIVNDESGANVDSIYYKSEFDSYTKVRDNAIAVSKQTQAEGTVLMTNKNALPLHKGAKVTFLSYSTVDVALGGTGSGAASKVGDRKYDLIKACANGKLDVNMTAYSFYKTKLGENYLAKNGALIRKTGGGFGGGTAKYEVPEINASDFTDDVKNSFGDYKDAAIFVLSRIGGEGADLITTSATTSDPSKKYLALSDDEKSVLQAMKDGPFAKRILLVNTLNAIELGFLDEYNIDACLQIGGPGEAGLDAVIDILVGTTNPSGKLIDTYAYDSFSSPAMQNFGDYKWTNKDALNSSTLQTYLVYSEGIYVGYKYYETRYEDTVLNRGSAASKAGVYASKDNWNYSEEVQFPFGYGLSYTTFTQTLNSVNVNEKAKTATVSVTVANAAGGVKGKDVVQVYAQAPYTAGGIEKAAIQLVGFAKTDEIEPGKSQTVEVTVSLKDLASYDENDAKTYVLEKGDYYFAIGNGAHDALNNVLKAKGAAGLKESGDASKAHKWTKNDFDADEYMLSARNRKITNQFADADLNYYIEDAVKYLSRNDWNGTWPKDMSGLAATDAMIKELNGYVTDNTTKLPSAYEKGSSDTSKIKTGAEFRYPLVTLRGVEYNDEAWKQLLDQLTVEDLLELSRQGRPGAPKTVVLPETTAIDGPSAWTKGTYLEKYDVTDSKDKKYTSEAFVAYPVEVVIAATWNTSLAGKIGESFGEEGLWGAGVGWYGPAANIHRTPYSGRNFEYFSEDGYISGVLCEAEMHGAQKKGVIPYVKHFFLNDQETNRISVCTFSNEQAIREIYLRAFQATFETTGENDPSCKGVMGAFNRIGLKWTGHHKNLWKNVMEGEWGFTGNITTDFGQNPTGLMEPQLAYEAGTTMFCTSGKSFTDYLKDLVEKDEKLMSNMRESAHRTLYNFANSFAMNGLTSTSKVVKVMTWYNQAFLAIIIVSAVVTAASAVMVVLQTFFKKEG